MNKEERIVNGYYQSNIKTSRNETENYRKKYLNAVADYEMVMSELQELKKHLEVPKQCNLKTIEDYKSYYEDTTKEEILKDTYIDYCAYVNLAHEYAKLKKQLEVGKNPLKGIFAQVNDDMLLRNCGAMQSEIDTYKNQQKEFIEYLENMLDNENDIFSVVRVKDVLSKYKEIIGGKE